MMGVVEPSIGHFSGLRITHKADSGVGDAERGNRLSTKGAWRVVGKGTPNTKQRNKKDRAGVRKEEMLICWPKF